MARFAKPIQDSNKFKSNEAAAEYLKKNGFVNTKESFVFPWHNPITGKYAMRAVNSKGYTIYYIYIIKAGQTFT